MALLSIRGYARHRAERGLPGQSQTAVQKALASGRIQIAGGLIDSEAADQQWEARSSAGHRRYSPTAALPGEAPLREAQAPAPEPRRVAEAPLPGGISLAQAYAIEKAYKARLARIEYEERSGKLVPAADVRLAWARLIGEARNKILGLPVAIKARVPSLTLAEVAVIDELVRETLEGLAEGEGAHESAA